MSTYIYFTCFYFCIVFTLLYDQSTVIGHMAQVLMKQGASLAQLVEPSQICTYVGARETGFESQTGHLPSVISLALYKIYPEVYYVLMALYFNVMLTA